MPHFGKTSRGHRDECHPHLIILGDDAIRVVDHSIICGHRDKAVQNELYPKYSRVQYPNSKHNKKPSHALDFVPYHPIFKQLTGHKLQITKISVQMAISYTAAEYWIYGEYKKVVGAYYMAANYHGYNIISGIDWDGDGDTLTDQRFMDYGHIQLR